MSNNITTPGNSNARVYAHTARGTPVTARKLDNKLAPIIRNRTIQAISIATLSDFRKSRQVYLRRPNAIINAQMEPTAAASVGVKTPPNIPPSMITIRMATGHKSRNPRNIPLNENGASFGASAGFRIVLMAAYTINIKANIIPGITPPAKRDPTEASANIP